MRDVQKVTRRGHTCPGNAGYTSAQHRRNETQVQWLQEAVRAQSAAPSMPSLDLESLALRVMR